MNIGIGVFWGAEFKFEVKFQIACSLPSLWGYVTSQIESEKQLFHETNAFWSAEFQFGVKSQIKSPLPANISTKVI